MAFVPPTCLCICFSRFNLVLSLYFFEKAIETTSYIDRYSDTFKEMQLRRKGPFSRRTSKIYSRPGLFHHVYRALLQNCCVSITILFAFSGGACCPSTVSLDTISLVSSSLAFSLSYDKAFL